LIQDAQAGTELIQILGEANKESIEKIDANLSLISLNMTKLTTQLSEIESLAAQTDSELEKQKNKTSHLYQEARVLFSQAQKKLLENQSKVSTSNAIFTEVLNQFEKLIETTQSHEMDIKEKLAFIVSQAPTIQKQCSDAKGMLDESEMEFSGAIALLQQAIDKHNEASIEAGKAFNMATENLKTIKEKARLEQDSQKEIADAQQELSVVRQRMQIQDDLLNDVQQTLQEAEEKATQDWGTFSTIMGAPIGFVAGNALAGTPGGIAGVPIGIEIIHRRRDILGLFFGKETLPVPEVPSIKNPITLKFNEKSTGLWGRLKKRPSYTAGTVALDLGINEKGEKETVSYTFNLNKQNPICKKNLLDLGKRLTEQLKNNRLSPKNCLNLLKQIESIEIDRGDNHSTKRGFVTNKSPYLAAIKLDCEVRLNNK
jgi:hypothetical protein